ncbi:leucine-rich repeat domain-containing protein [Breznakiellaceae bacterium SP9]
MDTNFKKIVQQIIAEKGREIFNSNDGFKSILLEYARGEYKKEVRLLTQVLDVGCYKKLCETQDITVMKQQLVLQLHEDYSLDKTAVQEMIEFIVSILFTVPTPVQIPPVQPPPAVPTAPVLPIPKGLEFELINNSVSITKYRDYAAALIIPDRIQGLPVTAIGDHAFFWGCSSLTAVTIPASLTTIGKGAFSGCKRLTDITVDSRNSSYESMNGILFDKNIQTIIAYPAGKSGTYTIPASVTAIRDSAFSGCSSLTAVTIPASVTAIEEYAFSGCSSLTAVMLPASVTTIGKGVFSDCKCLTDIAVDSRSSSYESMNGVLFDKNTQTIIAYPAGKSGTYTIPASVTVIGKGAFSGCSSLTAVMLPGSVTTIGDSAFSGCSGLTTVTIPASVTAIGKGAIEEYAFSGCSSLTAVTIPASVTTIGSSAFSGCSSLTAVTIPASVTTIGSSAFYGCSSLKAVTIPASVTAIEKGAFYDCSSLTAVTIPASVTTIGDSAFLGCSSLTAVTIPASLTTIRDGAFLGCSSLTTVTIPASVTTIRDGAFYGCSSLTTVTIPASVTTIRDGAFAQCNHLNPAVRSKIEAQFGSGPFTGAYDFFWW